MSSYIIIILPINKFTFLDFLVHQLPSVFDTILQHSTSHNITDGPPVVSVTGCDTMQSHQ